MKAIATKNLVSQDTYDQPMYQQVFHLMGFAIGSPVGTLHDASFTFRMIHEDFLKTSLVLETSSTMIRPKEKYFLKPHCRKDKHTLNSIKSILQ
jgi:hypothetical protein